MKLPAIKFMPGDMVYHRVDGSRGMVIAVQFRADSVGYNVKWGCGMDDWHEAIELSTEPCPDWELNDDEERSRTEE